ncbi:MAG TPA: VWA domain-containing protein, partial [Egibacteraceae bacterium]|nr:VWA domain-containing protein [Egibacteraceae bacterium]
AGGSDLASGPPSTPGLVDSSTAGAPQSPRPAAKAACEPVTLPAGATFDPVLLRLDGPGAGPPGRRSPAAGRQGRRAGHRLPSGPVQDLAVAATVRAAAPHQRARGRRGAGLLLRAADLRETVRQGREGNLVLFVVDASASMAARARMSATKGAVLSLLLDAYRRRDRVGLVTFRGGGAELALPPTGSVELAARLLADLPTGGRTPLAAGLAKAGDVLAVQAVRDPGRRPLVVVLTDGRATHGGSDPQAAAEQAAAALAARGVAGVVVDTEDGALRLGLAARVAGAMGAACVRLEELAAGPLAGLVRAVNTARRAP